MALPPLADVSDLAAWVGQEIPDGDPRAGAVLSAASALVRSYANETWADAETPDVVRAVVVQSAARVWTNPNSNLRSKGAGPFNEGYFDTASLGLYLTEEEKTTLAQLRGAQTGLGTIQTTRGLSYSTSIYVPTAPAPSGYPFPWYSADDV